MTTTSTAVPDTAAASPTPRRTWALAGLLAGLAGLVGIQLSLRIDAVYSTDYAGDAGRITDRLGDFVPELIGLHLTMMAASLLLVVFGAGLRRRLQGRVPAGSLLPDVAAVGLWLTSVTTLLGVAFSTEIVFGLTADGEDIAPIDPEFGAVVGHWVGTVPWLWVGAGLTGVALAVAALRHRAVPRWIGWASVVLGGPTLLLGISPLQYMAGFTGPVLVLLLGVGFLLGDRTD